MKTFKEYQSLAAKVPVSLRNNRERLELPVSGLLEESGKIGSLFSSAAASGKFRLNEKQSGEIRDALADILWYVALICGETGIAMQDVAEHSSAQLQSRINGIDPDRR